MRELIRSRSPGASDGSARGNRQGFSGARPLALAVSFPGASRAAWGAPARPVGRCRSGPALRGSAGPLRPRPPVRPGCGGLAPLACRRPLGSLVVPPALVGVGLRCGPGGGRWRGAGRGAWPVVVRSVARYRSTPGRPPPVRVPRPSRRGDSARGRAWCPCVAGAAGRGSAGSVFHIPRNWWVDSLWPWWYHRVVILYVVWPCGGRAICGRWVVLRRGGWVFLHGLYRAALKRRTPRAGEARSGG